MVLDRYEQDFFLLVRISGPDFGFISVQKLMLPA